MVLDIYLYRTCYTHFFFYYSDPCCFVCVYLFQAQTDYYRIVIESFTEPSIKRILQLLSTPIHDIKKEKTELIDQLLDKLKVCMVGVIVLY
jgi:hypothetical protein